MKHYTLIFLAALLFTGAHANDNDTARTTAEGIPAEMSADFLHYIDSIGKTPFFNYSLSIRAGMDTAFPESDTAVFVPDSIMEARLRELDMKTPFNMVYNDRVKAFIKLYTVKRREQVARMLGLSHYYFPLFEEVLDKYDMPYEIKYLAVVESALNPRARSRAGAVGIWQFMYSTGKIYDLEQNSYMDERMDPVKSTEAACRYLSFLYKIYGKWDLALAAYNCGPGNVNKAIRRSGKTAGNYWDIYPFLPRETRGYVPAFIAAHYAFSFAEEHGITPIAPAAVFFETDTVHVTGPINYTELAEFYDLDIEMLSFLNPAYKRDRVPAYSNKTSILRLPLNLVADFRIMQDSLIALSAENDGDENDGKLKKFSEDRVYYTVRSGDYLGRIAGLYSVSSRQIMAWNNMRSTRIRPGQRLIIYPRGSSLADKAPAPKKEEKKYDTEAEGNYVYYKIQSGDTLWDIAKARGVTVDELKRLNKNLNTSKLKPGTKIIVGTNG